MTYFTSWDTNVYLCLVSLGLPEDLVREWVFHIRRVNKQFTLAVDRCYHMDRFSPVVKFRRKWGCRKDVYGSLLEEYTGKLEDIESRKRGSGYFVWLYENHYYNWTLKDLEYVKGFHPGRFFLLDQKSNETLKGIRELESIGAWKEERITKKQYHIDDLLLK